MNKTALITTEKKPTKPILIVDKDGKLGRIIAQKLKPEFLVVFASTEIINEENIVSIPFKKKIPSIPDNKFSEIILVLEDNPKQIIKSFQKKSFKDGSKFSLIISKKNFNKNIVEDTLDFYQKTNVLVIGEIFAQDFIYDSSSDLSKLIINAKLFGNLKISNDGSKKELPVFLHDAVDEILESIFVQEKTGLFYIFPKNNTTILSLALMLKKKNPNLKLDFVKEKEVEDKEVSYPQSGKFMLDDPYSYEEKIKKIDLEKINAEDYKEKKAEKFPKLSFVSGFMFLFSLFILPLAASLIFLILGNIFIGKDNLIALKNFEISQNSYAVLKQELNFLPFQNKINFLENNISYVVSKAKVSNFLVNGERNLKNILSGKSQSPTKELASATLNYQNAFLIEQGLNNSNQNLDTFISLLDFSPSILGIDQQRNYLLLLQNSNILWPGGGKIEYYAVLSLNKGKLTGFKIYNAQDLDSLLKTHVEPPFAIRRYIPSINWYFKYANFDVDFSKDAIASAVFLNSETHQQVDGVIGVDSYFIKNLLENVGTVDVKKYSIQVNSDNFFEIINQSLDGRFKGAFYNAFFEKLGNYDFSSGNLFEDFLNQARQKHLSFAFNNASQQLAVSVNGLASSLVDLRQTGLNDFFGISETNLGNNQGKVDREILQTANIADDSTVKEEVTVNFKTYQNNYKNYLRFILPLGSQISNISIDGIDQKIIPAVTDPSIYEAKKFIVSKGLELETNDEQGKTIYGFLLNIDKNTTKKVTVSYTLLQKLKDDTYGLRLFKQPGIDSYNYKLTINSKNFNIVSFPKKFAFAGAGGTISENITGDLDLNFKLVPK